MGTIDARQVPSRQVQDRVEDPFVFGGQHLYTVDLKRGTLGDGLASDPENLVRKTDLAKASFAVELKYGSSVPEAPIGFYFLRMGILLDFFLHGCQLFGDFPVRGFVLEFEISGK